MTSVSTKDEFIGHDVSALKGIKLLLVTRVVETHCES